MRHFNLIEAPRRRIEITTFGDTKRTFLEPCYIETSPGGDPVDYRRVEEPFDPGVEWAIHHPREAKEYCEQKAPELTLTWWQFIKYLWRDAW